jgi:hypothetical protein
LTSWLTTLCVMHRRTVRLQLERLSPDGLLVAIEIDSTHA